MGLLQKIRGEMETERLILRRWRPSDFKAYISFASDPEVMLPAGAKPVKTAEEAETSFHRSLRDGDCFAIVLKETGKPIGKIKFQSDAHRQNFVNSLSVGYELHKDYWGRGYMPEALRAMIACAFEKRKVPVLGISHFAGNDRSRRVIEKCGFRYEGAILCAYRRFDGEFFDDECYSILREEYFEDREKYLGSGVPPAGELPGRSR